MTRCRTCLWATLLVALSCAGCRTGGAGAGNGAAAAPPTTAAAGPGHGLAWLWTAPAKASVGMPAGDDAGVAFTSGHQHLTLLDSEGRQEWDTARLGLRDVAPRLTADLVLAATDDGVAAFRRAGGAAVWDTSLQARANTPVVAGRLAVTSTWEGDLVALDLSTGKVAWRVALGGSAIGPPATDGMAVVATWTEEHNQAAGAVAVDAATGRTRWAVPLPPGGTSAPAVLPAGLVVAVGADLAAHALDLATGAERWRTPLDGAGSPEVPPVAVGTDQVLTAHRLGGLDLLDAATGRRVWQARSGGAAVRGGPVVGPATTFALPLDDGRLMVAGPTRPVEFRQAPGRISGLAVGPHQLLVAATTGAPSNTAQATAVW